MRDTDGRFLPGKSGNPGGRPRVIGHVRDMAQRHAQDAIEVLAEIMKDQESPASARIAASVALLDRGFGRPVDQRAMVLLTQNADDLRSVTEMPMEQLIAQLRGLASQGALESAESEREKV